MSCTPRFSQAALHLRRSNSIALNPRSPMQSLSGIRLLERGPSHPALQFTARPSHSNGILSSLNRACHGHRWLPAQERLRRGHPHLLEARSVKPENSLAEPTQVAPVERWLPGAEIATVSPASLKRGTAKSVSHDSPASQLTSRMRRFISSLQRFGASLGNDKVGLV